MKENKQALFQLVSQKCSGVKPDDFMEKVTNILDEEEYQTGVDVQPMYYCLECHKKLCKDCYQ